MELITDVSLKLIISREFPGDLVVRTQGFPAGGPGLDPWAGN